jgi:uracil-DNA glycosylase
MMSKLNGDWEEALRGEFKKPYYKELYYFIKNEYETKQIFPPFEDLFSAFHFTALKDVKVVILGQDPYHNDGQAHGLSFSVKPEVAIPPSLLNIYKELQADLGTYIPDNGYLLKWAKQGVFLLNAVLTVRAHNAASHSNKGWEKFTDAVIEILNKEDRPIVFLLWGRFAKEKAKMLNNPKHLVLTAAHPSPLSAYNGFFACKHFSKTNEFLTKNNIEPIDWQIDNLKG